MADYIYAVAAVLLLTSAVLIYVLRRHKLLDASILTAICLSALSVSLSFPFFAGSFSSLTAGKSTTSFMQIVLAFVFTLVAYITLVFIISMLISSFINDAAVRRMKDKLMKSRASSILRSFFRNNREDSKEPSNNPGKRGETEASTGENAVGSGVLESDSENNAEKSVDSNQIIDTMGIETGMNVEKLVQSYVKISRKALNQQLVMLDDSDEDCDELHWVSLEDDDYTQAIAAASLEAADNTAGAETANELNLIVEKAFSMKVSGQYENAIEEYMKALDCNPDKDLTFLLVLDICVLYKSLNQGELARDILVNYLDTYGDEMDKAVKDEIESQVLELSKY